MTHAALFVSLILTFTPTPPAAQSCSLPGLWLGQDRNKESVGMWLEFAPDGSVVRANGRIVDGDWQIKGDTLILTSQAAVAAEGEGVERYKLTQHVALKVSGDAVVRTAEAAVIDVPRREVRTSRGTRTREVAPEVLPQPAITSLDEQPLTRVTPVEQGQPAIVGIWGYRNKAGRKVLERYSPNRHFVVLEPLAAQRGTFTVAANKLAVTADGATTEVPIICGKTSFELDVNGAKMKFAKFE